MLNVNFATHFGLEMMQNKAALLTQSRKIWEKA